MYRLVHDSMDLDPNITTRIVEDERLFASMAFGSGTPASTLSAALQQAL